MRNYAGTQSSFLFRTRTLPPPCCSSIQWNEKDTTFPRGLCAMKPGKKCTAAAHCVLAQNPNNQELARFYCHTQNNISRRLVLRQDPSVKRTICKSCFSLLIPGVSSTVRQRKRRHQRRTVVQCLNCGLSKRFPSKPDYKLWSEQPEALLENQAPAGAGTK
ncbi:putative Ribonuclease P protein, partial [Naja naja]